MAISIISPTGRALQAELEQSQGMAPDQVMAKLNQNVGLVPFPELLAMKMQYDRLKNAQAPQPPPQGTVASDMAQEISSRQMGVAGLNPQNVGNNMAGGGIVAFAGGGFNASQWAEGIDVARANQIVEEAVRAGRLNPADYARYADPMASAAEKRNIWQRAVSGASRVGNTPVSEAAGKAGRFLTGNAGKASELVKGGAKGALGLGTILEGYTEGPRAVMGDAIPSERIYAHYGMDPYVTPSKEAEINDMGIVEEPIYSPLGFRVGTQTENDKQLERDMGVRALAHLQGIFGFGPERESKEEAAARLKAEEEAKTPWPDFGSFQPTAGGIADIYDRAKMGPVSFAGKMEEVPTSDRDAEIAKVRQEDTEQGIGKADEEELARLGKEREELKSDKKRDTWLSAAEGFFKMAQAASQPGATFLGSAAEGATTGLGSYKQLLKEQKQAEKELRAAEYAAKKSGEALKLSQTQRGEARHASNLQRVEAAKNRNAELQRLELEVNSRMAVANMDASVRSQIARLNEKQQMEIIREVDRRYAEYKRQGLSYPEAKKLVNDWLEDVVAASTRAGYGGYQVAELKAQQAPLGVFGGTPGQAGAAADGFGELTVK